MKKIFLDVNIVLDLIDKNRSHSQLSESLFFTFIKHRDSLFFSEDGLTTAYYVAKRNIPSLEIIKFFEYFREKHEILPFGKTVLDKSFEYCKNNPKADLEDVLQAFCAKENGCDFLVTNDINFERGIIDIVQVSDF